MSDFKSRWEQLRQFGRIASSVEALTTDAAAVPPVAPPFTGGAAAAINFSAAGTAAAEVPVGADANPWATAPEPAPGFVVPVPVVNDAELRQIAKFDATLIIGKVRMFSSVTRSVLAEMAVRPGDEAAVVAFGQGQLPHQPTEAIKRLERRQKLLEFRGTEIEAVRPILEEIIFEDLREKARQGRYRRPDTQEFVGKLIKTEAYEIAEKFSDVITDFGRALVRKVMKSVYS